MDINTFFCNIPVFIINLKDSIDRKEHVLKEFEGYTNLHFIEAIDGRKTDFKEVYNINLNTNIEYSNPCIAVICSHIKAIKKAYDNNLEYVCIFEDDVHTELIKTCNFTLNDICNLNSEWDAIQLFYTAVDLNILYDTYIHFKTNGLHLLKRESFHSGTCYIINKKGMANFLNNIIDYNNDLSQIKFKVNTIDPEDAILGHINSFIINRQVLYYYFNTATYDNYLNNSCHNTKEECQIAHLKTKNILNSFYK